MKTKLSEILCYIQSTKPLKETVTFSSDPQIPPESKNDGRCVSAKYENNNIGKRSIYACWDCSNGYAKNGTSRRGVCNRQGSSRLIIVLQGIDYYSICDNVICLKSAIFQIWIFYVSFFRCWDRFYLKYDCHFIDRRSCCGSSNWVKMVSVVHI